MKINVSKSKKRNSSHDVRQARKFRLRTDASRDTLFSHALNTQLTRVIAEFAIHQGLIMTETYMVMDGRNSDKSQRNLLFTT